MYFRCTRPVVQNSKCMQVHLEFITLNCHGVSDAHSIAGPAYIHHLERPLIKFRMAGMGKGCIRMTCAKVN